MTIIPSSKDAVSSHRTTYEHWNRFAVRLVTGFAAIALPISFQFRSLSSLDYGSVLSWNAEANANGIIIINSQEEDLQRLQQQSFNFTTLEPYYQNPVVLKQNCSVTVLFVDPDLGKDSMWALESVAANIVPLETTCVVLKTSICDLRPPSSTTIMMPNNHVNETKELQYYYQKGKQVRARAEPLFAKMIDQGNVRMVVLNHTKYHLKSCTNFYNPSTMLEHYDFWGPDEFTPHDSDLILMMQGDAALCHELNVDKWRDVAWVGAPWPAQKGYVPWMFCSSLSRGWKQNHEAVGSVASPVPTEDQVCSDTRYGPQGNGGLCLRSRTWLRKAIEYCPISTDRAISGLSREKFDAATCKANNTIAEDMYFVTILRGMGAPMPSNFEAALFSMELKSPRHITDQYNLNETFVQDMIRKRWYSRTDPSGMNYYNRMMQQHNNVTNDEDPLIPIGVHKPWNKYLGGRLFEDHLNEHCPYMLKVVENSRHGRKFLAELKAKKG